MPQYPDRVGLNPARRRGDAQRVLLMALFARMDPVAMSLAMGVVFAIGLFAATAVLLLKGAPPGVPVGPNLGALVTFLPGYSVTWGGGILGAMYGLAIGAVVGFVFSVFWNFTHIIFIGFSILRGNWLD